MLKKIASLILLLLAGCGSDLHWCIESPVKADCLSCDSNYDLYYCYQCTDGLQHYAMTNFIGKQVPRSELCR